MFGKSLNLHFNRTKQLQAEKRWNFSFYLLILATVSTAPVNNAIKLWFRCTTIQDKRYSFLFLILQFYDYKINSTKVQVMTMISLSPTNLIKWRSLPIGTFWYWWLGRYLRWLRVASFICFFSVFSVFRSFWTLILTKQSKSRWNKKVKWTDYTTSKSILSIKIISIWF